jgi:hypothetical protein
MRPLNRKEIARIPVLPYLQANRAAAVKFRLLGEQPLRAKGFHHGTHLIGNNFDFRGAEDDSMDSLKLGRHH